MHRQLPDKPEKEVVSEIQAIIRQVATQSDFATLACASGALTGPAHVQRKPALHAEGYMAVQPVVLPDWNGVPICTGCGRVTC